MLSDIAWKAFEATGNIDAYVLYSDLKGKSAKIDCSEFSRKLSEKESIHEVKE